MPRSLQIALLAFTLAACAGLQDRPGGGAPDQGFSRPRLEALSAQTRADVQNGRIPGAVMLVARNGKLVYSDVIGAQDAKAGTPMRTDSIFRIYSMTKPIVSVAIMMLVEEGRMQVTDPVSTYIPELKGIKVGIEKPGADGKPVLELVTATREMTIQDLLRHTSGLTYGVFGRSLVKSEYLKAGVDSWDQTNAEVMQKLAKMPLHYQPGTTWEYSRSTDVLGHVLERISGQPLDRYLEARILKPLGMKDTGFHVEAASQDRIAEPFEIDPDTRAKQVLAEIRRPPKLLSGGGGMVSTAADYLRFAQMLLNGGELDGVRLLSRKTVDYMTADHLGSIKGPAPGYGFGLGFTVRTATGEGGSAGTLGDYNWAGLGGTYFWIDPKEKLIAIWMMQAPLQRNYYRQFFRNMVYGAMLR